MKKIVLVVFAMVSMMSFAQETMKEGSVVMSLKMSSNDEQMNQQLAMMGADLTFTFKKDKGRIDTSGFMVGNNNIIIDNENKQSLVLINQMMMGKKYMKQEMKDFKDPTLPEGFEIKKTGDKKSFLGYDCEVQTMENDKMKMIMYVAPSIQMMEKGALSIMDQVGGFPLFVEITANEGGKVITVKLEASKVHDSKIADSTFALDIPEGYEEAKPEDLSKLGQGF